MQKRVNLVDIAKSFPTSIYLRNSASIQPRTSLSKFAKNYPKVRIEVRKNIGDDVSAGGCTAQSLEDFCLERSVTAGLLEVRKQARLESGAGRLRRRRA